MRTAATFGERTTRGSRDGYRVLERGIGFALGLGVNDALGRHRDRGAVLAIPNGRLAPRPKRETRRRLYEALRDRPSSQFITKARAGEPSLPPPATAIERPRLAGAALRGLYLETRSRPHRSSPTRDSDKTRECPPSTSNRSATASPAPSPRRPTSRSS